MSAPAETLPAQVRPLPGGGGLRIALGDAGRPLTTAQVIDCWRHAPAFAHAFSGLLAAQALDAFFWEMPPVTTATLDQPFECVLVDAPALRGVRPDPRSFAECFAPAPARVAGFANLGGDAWLLAPCPTGDDAACAHLADFVRGAEAPRQIALWAALGDALPHHLDSAPLWISTSGLGVPWLHLRLDRRPKYYSHAPYRAPR